MRFEPLTALVAGDEGLADLAQIIREGRQYLQPGGWMLLEHGWTGAKRCARCSAKRAIWTSRPVATMATMSV